MASDFSAVYVRLTQGALVAQLSKDIFGEAQPPPGQSAVGGSSNSATTGLPDPQTGTRQAERDPVTDPPKADAGMARQPGVVSPPTQASVTIGPASSEVVPDQLEPEMRLAADQRPTAIASDMVQRLRLAPAASLTLAGLSRPSSTSGEMAETQISIAQTDAPAAAGDAGQRPSPQPAGSSGVAIETHASTGAATDGPTGVVGGGAAGDDVERAEHRRASPNGSTLPTVHGVVSPQGEATEANRIAIARAEFPREGMEAKPSSSAGVDAFPQQARTNDGPAMRTTADSTGASRVPVLLSRSEALVLSAAEIAPRGADFVSARGPSLAGTPTASFVSGGVGETFLAAIATMGGPADQAISRDMLSAVILNAAMIPGWPFPRAIEGSARSVEASRAAGQIATAVAEEFKLTPEEMIAYLTSIGANARLLKALQDLFARVEKKEAVQLMAWLLALTSALREIEKSLEDLLRKGTRLPEWAEEMADQIRKGMARRNRYQI